MSKQKGQISPSIFMGIIGVVITLIALGIILATSQKSMATIRDTAAEDKQAILGNETLTWVANNTAIKLSQIRLISGTFTLYNNGTIVNQGDNYTLNLEGGSILITNLTGAKGDLLANASWVTNALNASYTYKYGSSERNITLTGQEGLKAVQEFQPTWSTVIAAAIAITLVIGLAGIFWYSKMS